MIPNDVTNIGNNAFCYCAGATSISIGNGCQSIGYSAFSGCSGATSISIGNGCRSIGNSAFSGCSSLTSVVIPDSVESIGQYAFNNCSVMTSIAIGTGVASLGFRAFCNCTSLADISVSGNVTNDWTSSYCPFSGCNAAATLTIGRNVSKIGDYMFYGLKLAGAVSIPDGVESIGQYAFYGCSGMTSITIGTGVTSIGNNSFYNCSGLTSVTIPDSVTSIGNQAFYYCSNLKNVRLSNIAAWCAVSFGDSYASPFRYAPNLYLDGGLVSDLVIPSGVTGIPPYAFYNCDCLQSVSIPDSVETIGDQAFGDCDNIEGVRAPQCVMTKGLSSVFRRAYAKITSLHLGADVSNIGSNEFSGFNALSSITVEAGNDDFVVSADGCLYDAERKTLYVCPRNATRVELPDGLENLSINSFQNCKALSSVVFPDSVSLIPPAAFNGCDALWTEWYRSLANFSAGGGSGGGGTATRISFTATNVVLHYVASAVPSGAVTPPTAEGLVNVVTEIGASRAIAVSSDWAAQYPGFENLYGTDFGAAIVAENGKTDGAGHPMFVWQDYVAGTDPTDPADAFTASIAFDATTGDPVIGWSPELPAAEAAKRVYTVFGKVRLNDENWTEVDGDAADYNFFKVRVEMK